VLENTEKLKELSADLGVSGPSEPKSGG
jgi:hypothetical protein